MAKEFLESFLFHKLKDWVTSRRATECVHRNLHPGVSLKCEWMLLAPSLTVLPSKANIQERGLGGRKSGLFKGWLTLRRWRVCHPQSFILGDSGPQKDFYRGGRSCRGQCEGKLCANRVFASKHMFLLFFFLPLVETSGHLTLSPRGWFPMCHFAAS
jgi:hypothetical protein